MPSPKDARNHSAKKTPDRYDADLEHVLARSRSQDFRSKIDSWMQEEVAAVESKPNTPTRGSARRQDAVHGNTSTPNTPTSAEKASPKETSSKKPSREIDPTRKAWIRRRSKSHAHLTPDAKADEPQAPRSKPSPLVEPRLTPSADPETTLPAQRTVTPRSRVISDDHWRQERSARKAEATVEKEEVKEDPTPKPKVVRRSVATVGLKVPPSVHDFKEVRELSPARIRPLRRQPRSRSTSPEAEGGRRATPDYESSGVKVYIRRRRKSKPSNDMDRDCKAFNTSESSLTAPSSAGRIDSATDLSIPDATPTRPPKLRSTTEPRMRPLKLFPTIDTTPPGNVDSKLREAGISAERVRQRRPLEEEDRRRIYQRATSTGTATDSFKIPATKASEPPSKVYGSRIEGWLASMPDDPFTEPSDASLAPAALKVPQTRPRRVDNAERDADRQRRGGDVHRRRSRSIGAESDLRELRKPASDSRISVDDWLDQSPASLKRTYPHKPSRSFSNDSQNAPARPHQSNRHVSDMTAQRTARHRIYGELSDRPIPSTGNRLSTIASVSSLREQRFNIPEDSVLSRASDGDEPTRRNTVRRSRSVKHDDLISVLSLPKDEGPIMNRGRTVRQRGLRPDNVTVQALMNEVSSDELKYQRELRTLVDGVVPVLLQYVLSQNGKSKSPMARPGFDKGDASLTQPIIDMGVVLERLKSTHRAIPMHDPEDLLRWAQVACKVYSDYLRVWRLGFNDIVVNLAPADQHQRPEASHTRDDAAPRNARNEMLDGESGERVDVAYLLKRPLVRMKTFSKIFKGIGQIQPSAMAEDVASAFEDLLGRAKQRAHDEHARLEDEAAAAIDPYRARNPCNLAPLVGVEILPTRCVRARDFFDLEFFHSSGQQLDCKIEVIFRDEARSLGDAGDVLFCEISPAGRWLLFPPISTSNVSARKGDKDGEMIVMIRGLTFDGADWSEMMSLRSDDTQSAEWIDMMGSNPMPPRLNRRSSFNVGKSARVQFASLAPSEASDVPIGEQPTPSASRWEPQEPTLHERTTEDRNDANTRPVHARSKSEWLPSAVPASQNTEKDNEVETATPPRRPTLRKRTSSVPTMQMPTISKLRRAIGLGPSTRNVSPSPDELGRVEIVKEPTSAPAKLQKRPSTQARSWSRSESRTEALPEVQPEVQPGVQPKVQPEVKTEVKTELKTEERDQTPRPLEIPQPPPGRSTALNSIPTFTPTFMQKPRRSSSPLKHEYEPSTATESSESELSDGDEDESVTSESSAEDEAVSTLGELQDFSKYVSMRTQAQVQAQVQAQAQAQAQAQIQTRPAPESVYSPDADTLGPSESASQAPYRSVPAANASAPAKSVACIFAWSESGAWENLHPGECQIVVTPGLIEAFALGPASGVKALVALELTPWVPLRRGTAVDISIRSPPTPASILQKGNHIMFRSRSPEECERLYNAINRARIDNPTWIALQNARGPEQTSNWSEVMERRNSRSASNSSAWFKALSRKGSTYRSKGTRSASIAGSQSSVGTTNTTFSALRQFGGGSKIFNIAKSTIMSKQSTRSSYSDSLSSGAATPLPIDPSMGTPMGITNAKIRLYIRESTAKWRDMGNARLTIMLPPRRAVSSSVPADPRITGLEKRVLVVGKKGDAVLDVTLGESCFERVARTGIAVSVWEEGVGSNGQIGHAAATGGVSSSKSTVYMIQMKSERDAAYTFSMVGKLRY